jgi:hypothetical protein
MSPTPSSGGGPVSDPDTKPINPAGPAGSPAPCTPSPSSSGRVLRVLTGVQNTSALVFSVFVGVHLVSPVVAAIGGASVADKSLVSDSSDVSCSSWVTWRVSHVSRLTYYHSFSPENTTSP